MNWRFWRKPKLNPDLNDFHSQLIHSVYGRDHDGRDVIGDFRSLFIRTNPALGNRVLFMLLTWCGEYEPPPTDNDALQRWAGKQDIAGQIKAAMYADLVTPPTSEEIEDAKRPRI